MDTCACGKLAKIYTSCSLNDPGRRFYTCSQKRDIRCDYVKWYDAELEGRHGPTSYAKLQMPKLKKRNIHLQSCWMEILYNDEKINNVHGSSSEEPLRIGNTNGIGVVTRDAEGKFVSSFMGPLKSINTFQSQLWAIQLGMNHAFEKKEKSVFMESDN
ncbi:hypothetical protein POM88_026283 [Heracleum sosnowskyi]|uniref:GRF-type domain-containing protein n=1 Tax=Heracleum sosnowskyi TaxID=360622 RepID=A0AAD8I5I8_9APIA|nr:hypothetical protein POM88_026283 [Heracleum sosnowskyi]